ncbi:hypothetical protein [Jiella mangrovi]|uniref:Uncharacterized protein n=1 Tax=Jiella mangrovi TaxID=2821407 RepID=A0ABS4BNC9_9HYPH|nr:hypothetical protein [Jiella mangrovi]MBP0618251.1 hypothetical protein [Jiella mangrovi]
MTRFLGNVLALVLLGAFAFWILDVLGLGPTNYDILCALSWVDGLIQAACLVGFVIGLILCLATSFKSPPGVAFFFGSGVVLFLHEEWIAPYLWGCVP